MVRNRTGQGGRGPGIEIFTQRAMGSHESVNRHLEGGWKGGRRCAVARGVQLPASANKGEDAHVDIRNTQLCRELL